MSNQGNDLNPGTAQAPVQSFWKARSLLQPGDTLVVQAGTYYGNTVPLNVTISGTPTGFITIMGDPTGRTTIIGAPGQAAIYVQGSYLNISNFEVIADANDSGVSVISSHHVRVENMLAHNSGCAGINATQSDYVWVQNNVVYDNAATAIRQCSGISIGFGNAFDTASGYHNLISGNFVYGNFVQVLVSSGPQAGFTTDGNGIIVDTLNTEGYTGGTTLVADNVAFGNGGPGIRINASTGVAVINNTLWQNNQDPHAWFGNLKGEIYAYDASGCFAYNNIAVAQTMARYAISEGNSSGDRYDYNFMAGQIGASGSTNVSYGTHSILGVNPMLVSPSPNPTQANFAPLANSPVIDAGIAVWAPATNVLGTENSRTVVDIGAY